MAVMIGVVAVTCGIVADSNHADSLTFLGVMVKTTAAQIFLTGAICTWALFASLWLLSIGIRRSKERGIELRAIKALRTRGIAIGHDAGPEADAEPTIRFDGLPTDLAPADFPPADLTPAAFAPVDRPAADLAPTAFAPVGLTPADFAPADFAPADFVPEYERRRAEHADGARFYRADPFS
ncbi:MAG TPA: hypothetical protein VFN97_11065 [Actinospica sp.]|nr:hypothetical protein [Actinospica sp.]